MPLTNNMGQTMTAQQAQQDAAAFAGKMNRGRRLPKIPKFVQEQQKNTVHVFNVGPWKHVIPMATYGTFTIPACPAGEPYAALDPPLPGVMLDVYAKDETEFAYFEEDTRDFARELLGDGPMRPQAYSLRHFGCFVAEGKIPTKEELALANKELKDKCMEYILEARAAHGKGPAAAQAIIRPEVHFVAAGVLNLTDEPWMVAQNPQSRQKCPICGAFADHDTMKCGNCKEHIFKPKEYAAYKASQKVVA